LNPILKIDLAPPVSPDAGSQLVPSPGRESSFKKALENLRTTTDRPRPDEEDAPPRTQEGVERPRSEKSDRGAKRSAREERDRTSPEDPSRAAIHPPVERSLGDLVRVTAPSPNAGRGVAPGEPRVDARSAARATALAEVEAAASDLVELSPEAPTPGRAEASPPHRPSPKATSQEPARDPRIERGKETSGGKAEPADAPANEEATAARNATSLPRADALDRDANGGNVRLPDAKVESTLAPAASTHAGGDALSRGVVREAAPPPSPVPPAGLAPSAHLDGILQQVRLQVRPGLQELTIRLEPPDLGSLHLRFVLQGDQLGVAVLASRADVAAALRTELRALEQTLRDAGVSVDSLDVDFALDPDERGPADRPFDDETEPGLGSPPSPHPVRSHCSPGRTPGGIDFLA